MKKKLSVLLVATLLLSILAMPAAAMDQSYETCPRCGGAAEMIEKHSDFVNSFTVSSCPKMSGSHPHFTRHVYYDWDCYDCDAFTIDHGHVEYCIVDDF